MTEKDWKDLYVEHTNGITVPNLSKKHFIHVQSIYTAIIMLAVVRAGVLADYIGRKKMIVAATFLFTVGWVCQNLLITGH